MDSTDGIGLIGMASGELYGEHESFGIECHVTGNVSGYIYGGCFGSEQYVPEYEDGTGVAGYSIADINAYGITDKVDV